MHRTFKFLLVASATALLVACGGGSDTASTQAAEQPAWASPAMFVPAGTSQLNVAVSSCEEGGGSIRALEAPQRSSSVPINSPSLVITSQGDAIFSGVRNGSSTVSEIARVSFSLATNREIGFSSNADQNGFYLQQGSAGVYTDYSGSNLYLRVTDANNVNYFCGSRAQLTAAYAPSEARLAEKFSRGMSSWKYIDDAGAAIAIANDTVVWDNFNNVNRTLSINQTNARYASLNVNTGALNVGPGTTASNVTQSVALSAALASGGIYNESDYTDPDFTSGRAKNAFLEFDSSSQGRLTFKLSRDGNVLLPTKSLGDPIVTPPPATPM